MAGLRVEGRSLSQASRFPAPHLFRWRCADRRRFAYTKLGAIGLAQAAREGFLGGVSEGDVMHDFPERDWKQLRRVHDAALQRYCDAVLSECESLLQRHAGTAHERYLELFQLLLERNEDMGEAFDDMRRSRAMQRLIAMRKLGVVSDEEMAGFTEETRRSVQGALALWE